MRLRPSYYLSRTRRNFFVGALLCLAIAACSSSSTTTTTAPTAGGRCSVTLTTSPATVDAAGGGGQVNIAVDRDCTWDARADADWIALVAPTSGQGQSTLRFTASENGQTSSRRGAVVVNEQRVDVVQAAAPCRIEISATGGQVGSGGGTLNVSVTAQSGCAWTASSQTDWIRIAAGRDGNGDGAVSLEVTPNGGAARQATVLIAGHNYVVSQSAVGSVPPGPGPTPQPPTPGCEFTATAASTSFTSAGGEGSVTVAVPSAGCVWAATSNVPWITAITTGGNGGGTARFGVAANTGAERSGVLTVAGVAITITQAAAPPVTCDYRVSPNQESFGASGGDGTIRMDASPSSCGWAASSSVPWITISSGASGTGNGNIRYSVAANTGAERTGSVTVAGAAVTIRQTAAPPCELVVSPQTQSVGNGGGDATTHVAASASSCSWTAVSNVPWITITSGGGSRTGTGDVGYTVAANSGGARTGTLTVAGGTVTVNQAAAPACTLAVTPQTQSVGAPGGENTVSVDASASTCAWSSTANAPWITITSGGGNRTGDGDVRYAVAANTGGARSGTLTVAGATVTVNQAAAPPCTFAVTPLSRSFNAQSGDDRVNVNASADSCPWSSTSNAAWITITTGGGSRTGDGEIRYAVAANPGAARTGTLTVAGATVTITQDAASINVSGPLSGLSGVCPALTFTVSTRLVRTNAATDFDARCDRIRNGDNLTVTGLVQLDNSLLATRVR